MVKNKEIYIALLSLAGIFSFLILYFLCGFSENVANWPLWITLALGGAPLVWGLVKKIIRRQFGSDLLAGISIVASAEGHLTWS